MLAISLSYNDNRTWRGIWIILNYNYDLMLYSYYQCLVVMQNMLTDNHAYCTRILMLDMGQHFFLYCPFPNLNLDL